MTCLISKNLLQNSEIPELEGYCHTFQSACLNRKEDSQHLFTLVQSLRNEFVVHGI